ncbi:MAG: xanthan lyase [Bacteroidales bacterium]|nr:xanthan lyase [Bacteroidales bacterium]MBD5248023.1 xanthan lyase [Barnesiella sp.]MBD5257477.1 xanthan lyase [Barnesiella sp.]
MKRITANILNILLLTVLTAVTAAARQPVVRDDFHKAPKGLDGRNIALWQSHGRYFNIDKNRWLWQRAHLMQTIEDTYSTSYVLDLLVPMLENAGAYVMLPRERDINDVEVIIDADSPSTPGYSEVSTAKKWGDASVAGFRMPDGNLKDRQNPFTEGKVRAITTVTNPDDESLATWNATIPRDGEYTLYISYASLPNSSDAVKYTVHSLRGDETFTVDQTMGGGTWIALGSFPFAKGKQDLPLVTVTNLANAANAGKTVTADAVRIGGGMGNVARGKDGQVSGLPRWLEGARYWLQWAGAPADVYSKTDYENDYTDDFNSRPLWVNYLTGGSERYPKGKGLGIPVDLAFALHTDAGTTPDSTIVGTMGIYCTDGGTRLGDGRRRTVCRDLTESIVNTVVNDLQTLHEPLWTKRKTRDRKYAEARIPQVPSALVELLSHQNFADMRHGQNPQFRFDAARAIYKGMLKYLYGAKGGYVVQPLPVSSFLIEDRGHGKYMLRWEPTPDPLESSAMPDSYYVELSEGDSNIYIKVAEESSPRYEFKAEPGVIYNFRIIAANKGGISFPSETLSLCHMDNDNPQVLIVNGFTRLSSPDFFDTQDEAGFLNQLDHGVPYRRNIAYAGAQYNFDRSSEWVDDEVDPGFGASYSDFDGRPVAGNTFDYPRVHGAAIAAAGYPFISASLSGYLNHNYKNSIIDLILGKQKEVQPGNAEAATRFKAFPAELQQKLREHTGRKGSLLVSGAYIASDLYVNPFSPDSAMRADARFAAEVLGIAHESSFAAVSGKVNVLPFWANSYRDGNDVAYASQLSEEIYVVESPDAIVSADRGVSQSIMTYDENGKSAAVASRHNGSGVIAMGFPFETIRGARDRDMLMAQMLLYLRTTRLPIQEQPKPTVKFDHNYRFPTGTPASCSDADIEITR